MHVFEPVHDPGRGQALQFYALGGFLVLLLGLDGHDGGVDDDGVYIHVG
jgi:hypothetical protein